MQIFTSNRLQFKSMGGDRTKVGFMTYTICCVKASRSYFCRLQFDVVLLVPSFKVTSLNGIQNIYFDFIIT